MTATKQFSIVDVLSRKEYAVVDATNEGQAMRRFDAVRHIVQGLGHNWGHHPREVSVGHALDSTIRSNCRRITPCIKAGSLSR